MNYKYKNILFFGRKFDKYSKNLNKILKKKVKNVKTIWSDGKTNKISLSLDQKYDFIICFRSNYILTQKQIKLANIAAINFHPGTPKYRGIGCINLALLNNEKEYGSTAHLMNKKIDAGKIIDVSKIKISKNDNLESLIKKTHKNMYNQSKFLLKHILADHNNLNKFIDKCKIYKWSKKLMTRKKLNKLYKLNFKNKKINIQEYNRSLSYKQYKPYFEIDGFIFKLI